MKVQAIGALTGAVLAQLAMAQPAVFTDMGNHSTAAETITQDVTITSPSDIQWFKIVLPATPSGSPAYVDVWTESGGGNPMTDTEVGVYNNTGALVASDDDDGDGLFTALSFGATTPTRPAIGTGVVFNGRDGNLAGGIYWLAVGRFNVNYGATGWGAVGTYIGTQTTTTLKIATLPPTASYPPSGTGATNPTQLVAGEDVVFAVTTTPGGNPTSTGITVRGDLSAFGGNANQAFFDNGTNGDATPNDGVYSYRLTTSTGTPTGTAAWSFTVADAQSRSSNGTGSVVVYGTGTWREAVDGGGDAGSLPATAQALSGSGPCPGIVGNIESTTDVDMYQINLCEPANFSATTVGNGNTGDTQLFLFRADGTGVVVNDDSTGVLSTLTNAFTASLAPGSYLLALTRYNVDPVDSGGSLLWINTPFNSERAPDGPGAANPVANWTGTSATGAYFIALTGVCRGGGGGGCVADINHDQGVDIQDLVAFLVGFEDGNASVSDIDNGTRTGTQDGAVDINDLVYFLIRFEDGC